MSYERYALRGVRLYLHTHSVGTDCLEPTRTANRTLWSVRLHGMKFDRVDSEVEDFPVVRRFYAKVDLTL